MSDLQKLLGSQNFKTEEDLQKFMDSIVGKPLPTFARANMNAEELAQELVWEAMELPAAKAKKKIMEALVADPDCIAAYEWLGGQEEMPQIAMAFFNMGITIGRKKFGGKYLEEHKGHFWGFHETRPFMRCMQQSADCLYVIGKTKESVAVLEEMIELNPNDNQGVRDQLLLMLIELNAKAKFKKYTKLYKEDHSAFAFYNRALFAFKTEGESENANTLLQKALEHNKHVPAKLISTKPSTVPNMYGLGDENEANYYAAFAQEIWQDTKGAIAWLKKNKA